MVQRHAIIAVMLFLFMINASGVSLAGESVVHSITLKNRGSLMLQVPASWREERGKPVKGFPTVVFRPESGRPFSVLITPMWDPKMDTIAPPDSLKSSVQAMFDEIKDQAVEKTVELRELKGSTGSGWHFTATDPDPKPGEYRYMTRGAIQNGSVVMVFTILTNDGQKRIIANALSMLKNTTIVSLKQKGSYRIPIPSTGLVIEFPSGGFTAIEADEARPYYFFENKRTGLKVSFNFEPAKECSSSRRCRDYFAAKQKALFPFKTQWRMSEVGEVSVSENMDSPVSGFSLRMYHMNAHFVRDQVWIDMHLSKADFRDSDRELFTDFIQSVIIRPGR